jgi:hypothetical protein
VRPGDVEPVTRASGTLQSASVLAIGAAMLPKLINAMLITGLLSGKYFDVRGRYVELEGRENC